MTTIKTSAQNAKVSTEENKLNIEKATVKANQSIFDFMDKSLFVSNSGQSKETIYKVELFSNLITDRDKKSFRRKLRNTMDSFVSSFIAYDSQKNADKLSKLKVQFDSYYKEVYRVNDYSINSLISNNTDQTKKESIQKMLNIISKIK